MATVTEHKVELIEFNPEQKCNENSIKLQQKMILSRLYRYFQKLIFYQKLDDIDSSKSLQILDNIKEKLSIGATIYTNFESMIEKEIGINKECKELFDTQYHKLKEKYGKIFVDESGGKCYFENDSISLESIDCSDV
eukprot:341920_1